MILTSLSFCREVHSDRVDTKRVSLLKPTSFLSSPSHPSFQWNHYWTLSSTVRFLYCIYSLLIPASHHQSKDYFFWGYFLKRGKTNRAKRRRSRQASNPRLPGYKSRTLTIWPKGLSLGQVAWEHDHLEAYRQHRALPQDKDPEHGCPHEQDCGTNETKWYKTENCEQGLKKKLRFGLLKCRKA